MLDVDLSKIAVLDLDEILLSTGFLAALAGDSDFLACFLGETDCCLFAVDYLTGEAETDFMGEDFLETEVAAFLTVFEFDGWFLTGETLFITTSLVAAEAFMGDCDLFFTAVEDLFSLSAALLPASIARGMAKPSPSLAGELVLLKSGLIKALKIALSWLDS